MDRTILQLLADGVTAAIEVSEMGDGRLAVTKVTIEGDLERGGVTVDDMRLIRFTDAYKAFRAGRRMDSDPRVLAAMAEIGAKMRAERPRDRGRWSTVEDAELARFAEMYLDALSARATDPVQAMYDSLGRKINIATIRDRLKACREFGWLVNVRPGQSGADAGPSLIHYRTGADLEEASQDEAGTDPTPTEFNRTVLEHLADAGVEAVQADETSGKDRTDA